MADQSDTTGGGAPLEAIELAALEPVLVQFPKSADQLMPVLRAVQDTYGYLPPPALRAVAEHLGISWAKVYGVASFYAHFHLTPRGRHTIRVCRGTACHVRGSKRSLDAVKQQLKINQGETSPDLMFSLDTVACLGTCSLSPVIMIDNQYYGRLTVDKVGSVLNMYKDAQPTLNRGVNSK